MKNAIQMIALSSLLLSASVASAETVVANLSQPFGLAMAPNGNLWVSQYNNGHISVLSPTADRVLSTFAAAPEVTDAAFAGNLAIYSSEYGNAVYAVNATTHAPVYEIPVYSAAVANVAIAPNGVGYITSDPATITLFQPATGAVLGTMSTGGENPRGIAFNAAGTIMAVANKGSASLNLINLRTLRVMRVVPVGQSPRDVVISGEFAYTANYDSNTVSRVNIENGEVTATVGVGSEPRRLAISGQRLFVSNEAGNSVSIINLATMAVIRTIALGATPRNIVVSPDGTTLYVSVLGANQVVKINVAAN